MLKVLPSSTIVNETCWSLMETIIRIKWVRQRHQRLGSNLGLELTTKILRSSLANQSFDKECESIHASTMKQKSCLLEIINFCMANLVGELARPMTF